MNKTLFFLFLLSFINFGLSAQDKQTAKADSIIFEKLIHDYGTLVQGSDGTCEFTFTGKGAVPLILSNVQASCGCTVAEWPREPILSGGTGSIKVKYNTNIMGSFIKVITVNSNAVNSSVILTIKGNITPKPKS